MQILVLNPGSSSLKREWYRFPEAIEIAEPDSIDAVGVRVVHGGSRFVKPVRVDEAVLEAIRELSELAPLHNPLAVRLIEETRAAFPRTPIVAVFDTAFHQTLPPHAAQYAIPPELNLRRYGFHGISYAYIASRIDARRHIVCHLGNGASVCALENGRSIDTSMGFTPMEGLVMGTRAGDLDPGILLHLLRNGFTEERLDELLNHRSGLAGLSGRSGDLRELESAAREGDRRAELAIEIFAYRAAKYVGAYAVALQGIDALTFTAGIGEHSHSMRARICARLTFLGIELDEELNRDPGDGERRISRGPVAVWVIPTNEELEIARLTWEELARG